MSRLGPSDDPPLVAALPDGVGRSRTPGASSSFVARRVFLGIIGLSYLSAFLSLAVQVRGLIGERGIEPAAELLAAVAHRFGAERFWLLPTLCWLGANDAALVFLCVAGAALAFVVVAGVAPAPVLASLWLVYLSLVGVGGEFLRFQWDALLLESGFLAVFLFPPSWRRAKMRVTPPSPLVVALVWWLVFRVMLSSGLVKLVSGDPTWRSLSALEYHYWSQPLPTWVAWYLWQLPAWFHGLSALLVFVVELAAPWLVFFGSAARATACVAFIALQAVIALSGNYGFFNLLAVGLSVLLVDDRLWPPRWRARFSPEGRSGEWSGGWPRWILVPVVAIVLLASTLEMSRFVPLPDVWPEPIERAVRVLRPFGIVSGYGLFAVMTTTRPEIIVEGSDDGRTWAAYEFAWKPGDPDRRPPFVAPHMPRLDWQMWFAALGSARQNPWFVSFCHRLLENEPTVIGLLAENPFPNRPPRFIRARVFEYEFTRAEEGTAWWRRRPVGLYFGPLSVSGRVPPGR